MEPTPLPWLSTSVTGTKWPVVWVTAFVICAFIRMSSIRLLLYKWYSYANDITHQTLFGNLYDDTGTAGVLIADIARLETHEADSSRMDFLSARDTSEITFDHDFFLAISTPLPGESGFLRKTSLITNDRHLEASHTFLYDAGHLDNVFIEGATIRSIRKPPAPSYGERHMDTFNSAELGSANGSPLTSD